MAKKSKTDLEVKEPTDLVAPSWGESDGEGYEQDSENDVIIPRLVLLQFLSPQVIEGNEGFIEGARPGMLYNTATQELSKSVRFVVAKTEKCYNEWVPRESGGGFVARHEVSSDLVKQVLATRPRGQVLLDNGNELKETQYIYGGVLDQDNEPTGSFVVISFTSTQLGAWREWNSRVRAFTVKNSDGRKVRPPIYAHVVEVTTVSKSNDKGSYYNFSIHPHTGDMATSLLPSPSHPAIEGAQQLRKMIEAGMAKASSDEAAEPPQDNAAAPF